MFSLSPWCQMAFLSGCADLHSNQQRRFLFSPSHSLSLFLPSICLLTQPTFTNSLGPGPLLKGEKKSRCAAQFRRRIDGEPQNHPGLKWAEVGSGEEHGPQTLFPGKPRAHAPPPAMGRKGVSPHREGGFVKPGPSGASRVSVPPSGAARARHVPGAPCLMRPTLLAVAGSLASSRSAGASGGAAVRGPLRPLWVSGLREEDGEQNPRSEVLNPKWGSPGDPSQHWRWGVAVKEAAKHQRFPAKLVLSGSISNSSERFQSSLFLFIEMLHFPPVSFLHRGGRSFRSRRVGSAICWLPFKLPDEILGSFAPEMTHGKEKETFL